MPCSAASWVQFINGQDTSFVLAFNQQALVDTHGLPGIGASELESIDGGMGAWTQRVRVDLPLLRDYTAAVRTQTFVCFDTVQSADLGEVIDPSVWGLRPQPRGEFHCHTVADSNGISAKSPLCGACRGYAAIRSESQCDLYWTC